MPRHAGPAALVPLALALAAAAPAPAASVHVIVLEQPRYESDGKGNSSMSYGYGRVIYEAGPGELNSPQFTREEGSSGGVLVVSDPGVTVTPGAGCEQPAASSDRATCAFPKDTNLEAEALLGDGDDHYRPGPYVLRVRGGPGNDTIAFSPEEPRGLFIAGDEGDDTLTTDSYGPLEGGPGNDRLEGTELCGGRFEIGGYGSCADRADQPGYQPDDGDDRLIANAVSAGSRIAGGTGNDRLIGAAGAQWLLGGPGADVIEALGDTPGPRRPPWAQAPDAHLPYHDDVIHGDSGDDHIDTRDGAWDHITCGPGIDTALRDNVDDPAQFNDFACESLTPPWPFGPHAGSMPPRPPAGPPTSGPPAGGPTTSAPPPGVLRLSKTATVDGPSLVLTASCGGYACSASIAVQTREPGTRAARSVGSSSIVLRRGRAKLDLRISKKVRAAVAANPAKLRATVRQPGQRTRKVELKVRRS